MLSAGAMFLAFSIHTTLAADYTWNSSVAATWTAAGAWSPSTPSGVASAIDLVTPTAFGSLEVNANHEVNSLTYNSGSSWILVANGGAPVTLTIDGTLSKSGTGTLTFESVSAASNSQLLLSIGQISLSAGTIAFGIDNSTTPAQQVTVTGTTTISGGSLTVNSPNATFGEVDMTGGTFAVLQGAAGTSSVPNVGGATVAGLSGTGGSVLAASANSRYIQGTLTIATQSGTNFTYGGQIIDRGSANTGGAITLSVVKTGTGTQTLSGTNTYTGATTVNAGTLLINGSLAAGSAVGVVANTTGNAVLGGIGTINGAVSVGGGSGTGSSIVAPGTDGTIGTLSAAGGLSFVTGAAAPILKLDINTSLIATAGGTVFASGSLADLLAVTGTLSLGSGTTILTLNDLGSGTLASGDVIVLATAGLLTGTFSGYADNSVIMLGNNSYQLNYGSLSGYSNDVTLDVLAVPEPSAWALGLLGIGFLLVWRRSRPLQNA